MWLKSLHPKDRDLRREPTPEIELDKIPETQCCCFCACVDDAIKYKQTTCKNMLKFLENSITPTPYLFQYLKDTSNRLIHKVQNTDEHEAHGNPASDDEHMNDPALELFTLCVNCDSWIRRQSKKPKSFLHADAVFLNILFPGRFELPEERSCLRVVYNACVCNGGFNFLQSVAPVVAKEFFAVFSAKYVFDTEVTFSGKEQVKSGKKKDEHWHVLSPNSKIVSLTKKFRRHEHKSHIKNKLVYIWWQRNRRCEFLSNKYTAKHLRHIVHGMP